MVEKYIFGLKQLSFTKFDMFVLEKMKVMASKMIVIVKNDNDSLKFQDRDNALSYHEDGEFLRHNEGKIYDQEERKSDESL